MFKVLIVDDESDIRNYLSLLIKQTFRFRVITASNGKEALEILHDETPDIICLDITMPVMDGVEFVKRFRKTEYFKTTTVIILSAVTDKSVISKLASYGIKNYVLKPFDYSKTQEKLKKIIYPVLEEKKFQTDKTTLN